MGKESLLAKSQTFDLENAESDYIEVLKVLYSTPRLYQDLFSALCNRISSFKRVMLRLEEQGFVDYQSPVIINTVTGITAEKPSKPVYRYILSQIGSKKLAKYKEDGAFFDLDFKKVGPHKKQIIDLLDVLNLHPPHSRYGLSASHLEKLVKLNPRTLRWWLDHLVAKDLVELLPVKYSDTRILVPGHYRITKELSKQIELVVKSIGGERNEVLLNTLHTKRSKYLSEIKVARVGINGATDYEHDIDAQRIMAKILLSDRFVMKNLFEIEPRISLRADRDDNGDYIFQDKGHSVVFYQPDALFKEKLPNGGVGYSFLEYERFQSRKDGWEHIEKFIGCMFQRSLPFETGTLRFVVDGVVRQRVYVKLIEAYTDSVLDNPELLPKNPLTIKVTTLRNLLDCLDPLKEDIWYSIDLPSGQSTQPGPRLHGSTNPYAQYFSRGRQWE